MVFLMFAAKWGILSTCARDLSGLRGTVAARRTARRSLPPDRQKPNNDDPLGGCGGPLWAAETMALAGLQCTAWAGHYQAARVRATRWGGAPRRTRSAGRG